MANPILQQAIDTANKAKTVLTSVKAFLDGLPAAFEAAKQAALANGASEAELQPFVQLDADINAQADAVAAAVVANTPAV